ncbi:MAG: glycoside hydrolase family 3 N-terminal domain-containing protein [Pseudomonadota bacterium]
MEGILTIGVVLDEWLENTSIREKFNELIKNPIIREVSIFCGEKKAINLTEVKQFSDEIRGLRTDIDIAVDQEGGLVQRLRGDGFTQLPQPDDLRRLYKEDRQGERDVARACGIVTAYELRHAGINILYGPVLDTYNPNSAAIGKRCRSYGNPPDSTDLLEHYLKGINGCLYTVVKHFPDHGQVVNDTHAKIATDERSVKEIDTQSLPPYKSLTYDALMIPHVIYSSVDELPATLSKKTIDFFIDKIKKNPLPLFSDALEMDALKAIEPTINKRVYRCLNSGCDAILYCGGGGNPERDYLTKLNELLEFIAEKKQTEPAFLCRYREAEDKIKSLSARELNSPLSLEEYNVAKRVIDRKLALEPEPTVESEQQCYQRCVP